MESDNIYGVEFGMSPEAWRKAKKRRECARCENPVPDEEYEVFLETHMCSWCTHMAEKLGDE